MKPLNEAKITPLPLIYLRGNEEVAKLMGLPDVKMVTTLVKEKKLQRYPRGKGFVFKVSDCLTVADCIDRGIIVAKVK